MRDGTDRFARPVSRAELSLELKTGAACRVRSLQARLIHDLRTITQEQRS